MSKSILVVDAPKSCVKCQLMKPISTFTNQGYCCSCNNRKIDYILKKPDWCPLRDMPERKPEPHYTSETAYTLGLDKGWNNCIDEILREAEGDKENEAD